jgi:hypothetical protein
MEVVGLAIITAVAEQMGGELRLHSPIPGRESGFQAVLRVVTARPA